MENLFEEVIDEKFHNLGNETDIHEMPRTLNKMNPRRSTPRHIRIKVSKIKEKERILRASRESMSYIQGKPVKPISWLFSRNSTGQKVMA